jgi:hypothetical protein
MVQMLQTKYFGSDILVLPGDEILFRRWFRNSSAIVVHVPGISPPHRDFGDEFVQEVGIRTAAGRIYGVAVDPASNNLPGTVKFCARGKQPAPLPEVLDDEFESERSGT